jgi:adenine-specific DNA-methyltransferase
MTTILKNKAINLIGSRMIKIAENYSRDAHVVLHTGDCRDLLKQIPDGEAMLIVTSPPYNVGKEYEKRMPLQDYLKLQSEIIRECVRILNNKGSICWEIGNYVEKGEIFPLDVLLYNEFKKHGLKLRNRIVWHFEHGLHCSKRFSGRHETILWFTKTNNYVFNLDSVRVPQKYPGKRSYKGKNRGLPSAHPLGKNPGDVWIMPNVKHNHPEKTIHPCQFPVGLIENLVLSMTNRGDLVFDPFMGVGTTAVAAILHGRRAAGADIVQKYIDIAKERVTKASLGTLKTRPRDKPIYVAPANSKITKRPFKTKRLTEWK